MYLGYRMRKGALHAVAAFLRWHRQNAEDTSYGLMQSDSLCDAGYVNAKSL
jgi:hypothetical protein